MFARTVRQISGVARNSRMQGCAACLRRQFGIKPVEHKRFPLRYLGQPSPFTHPHLLKADEVTPGLTQTEYALRRHKLMSLVRQKAETLGSSEQAVIVLSNPTYYMTNDIPFPFHQNTNFLYLCGFQEPDSILLLHSHAGSSLASHRAVLFVPRRDRSRELWDGPRSGVDGAVALTGVEEAHNTEDFRNYVQKFKEEGCTVWYDQESVAHPKLHQDYLEPLVRVKSSSENRIQPVRTLIQSLRLVKSAAEVRLLTTAAGITSEAFINTMASSKVPVEESYLYAKFDFECRAGGADFLAYPPVVAGGNRSNVLHYVKNNQTIKDGEMVLLDGGCEYFGYVSDVTRTWPINGRFTGPQSELYQAVLDVQKSCLSLCMPGITLDGIYAYMLALISKKLSELGIANAGSKQLDVYKGARKLCPHHVGHYLGMDVHDTPDMPRSVPLQPGMVLTIEPGIYIPEDEMSVPQKFRGLGVRIEDDVLVTEEGPVVLSASCPKELLDIQEICLRS